MLKATFSELVIRGGMAYMLKKLVVSGAAVLAAAALPASAWFGRGLGFGGFGFGRSLAFSSSFGGFGGLGFGGLGFGGLGFGTWGWPFLGLGFGSWGWPLWW